MKPQDKKTIKEKETLRPPQGEELPSNPRIITEETKLTWGFFLSIFTIFILLVSLYLLSVNVYEKLQSKKNLETAKTKVSQDISFWEEVIKERPDYRDAYFELAVLEYKKGDFEKAKKYLDKVFELDPVYQPAILLFEVLSVR